MATQTLMLFADIGGPAVVAPRRGDAYAEAAAGDRRLIRSGLAAHGR